MNYVLLFGLVKHKTQKAILFSWSPNKGVEVDSWIPNSQVEDSDAVSIGDDEIYVSGWFHIKLLEDNE